MKYPILVSRICFFSGILIYISSLINLFFEFGVEHWYKILINTALLWGLGALLLGIHVIIELLCEKE